MRSVECFRLSSTHTQESGGRTGPTDEYQPVGLTLRLPLQLVRTFAAETVGPETNKACEMVGYKGCVRCQDYAFQWYSKYATGNIWTTPAEKNVTNPLLVTHTRAPPDASVYRAGGICDTVSTANGPLMLSAAVQ